MKNILKISFLMISIPLSVLNASDVEDYSSIGSSIRDIEENISCLKLNDKSEKIECVKKRIEYNLNNTYKNKIYKKVQLGKFSEENNAKKIIKKYNDWKKNKKSLKNSKVEIQKYDEAFFVFVSQKGINSKKLQKNLKKSGWVETYISNQAMIIINMEDKIIREMKPHTKMKILKQKATCYTSYKDNQNELIKCLKEEAIHAIQIHSFFAEGQCNQAVEDWKKKHDKKNKLQAQCEKKIIKNEEYYYVMISIESSAKTKKEKEREIMKREKEIRKEKSDAFVIRKTEVLIK